MTITFNNHEREIQEQTSVQFFLNHFIGEKQNGIAVAVNETVITKAQWAYYVLQSNDKVLVIKATQGG